MPASEKSKSRVSSKSKDRKSDKKDKKDKKSTKSESKEKSSKKSSSKEKKDKKDKRSERDKSVKSTKSDRKSMKSSSPSKSSKPTKEKKDKDAKSIKSKKESQVDEAENKSAIDMVPQVQTEPMTKTQQAPAGKNMLHMIGKNMRDQVNIFANTGPALGGLTPKSQYGGGLDRKRVCLLHKQPLRYFCASCEELICYDCTVMGPHNTQLHRISSIDESFRYRFDCVNKSIHSSLVPKRAQLIGQIVRLDHRLDEIKAVKGVIEKDIRNEYAGIMERLRSAEGVKLAVLQHDIAEVQKDITRIDEILMTMEEIASGDQVETPIGQIQQDGLQAFGPDQLQFLHKYRQLNDNIEYSVTKHFKVQIDVMPNDLPRELAERRVLMDHYEEQRKLLKFKDDIVWKLSQELKKKYDYFQDEFDKETRNEMNEWARLVDRYGSELKKFELVCSFCGQNLSEHNLNSDCQENQPNILQQRASASLNSVNIGSDGGQVGMYYTLEEPPVEHIGRKRHWFGKPGLKGITGQQAPRSQYGDDIIQSHRNDKIPQGGADAILNNQSSMLALRQIAMSDKDLKSQLENQLKFFDQNQQGTIKKDDFINVIFEVTKGVLQPSQAMNLTQAYVSNQTSVNYIQFIQTLIKTSNSGQDDAGPHMINAMREQVHARISQLNQHDRQIMEKLRSASTIAAGSGIDFSGIFSKFAGKGQDKIGQDELLIAMSRISDSVQLGDVKELHRIVVGAPTSNGIDDVKIPINEVIQLLTL